MARTRKTGREEQYENQTYLDLLERVAHNTIRIRKAQKLTQEKAAERCAMSTRMIQKIEGSESNLTFTTLARLCDGLGVEAVELLGRVASE